ncbi:MAG TPA: hypothetical protein PKK74_03115 [Candidatus Methanoculleus thermohydrogenotrophicum]|jgi:plastocyanin|nr:hypothetical protein [Candidatus Methanoculleus thermohydrogenotrophicum]NLM82813.1 hypothetical protein [Candidatus Methanoculleus thermohydrogenotrophicum]HOB17671.1 hypothetical protein [Candidatus Methanoculleus thermohydrogenotrophicum]HPZ37307.1 hypothetical protein [Candidatus Methanoculleus thermohydrogenotrophicum]
MKRMFGILALMVVASIMIAGCVQPAGNETVTPVETGTPVETETPITNVTETPVETETPITNVTETPVETETPITNVTETPVETETSITNVTETPPAPPAGEGVISITGSGFNPDTLTVPIDSTVTWINAADTNQTITITGPTGSIDLGAIEPGDSADYTFSTAGNYAYESEETGFDGTITVTENITA